MNPISNIFASLPDRNLPARQISEQISYAQGEAFFHLAVAKNSRISVLRQGFADVCVRKVFLSANLTGFECEIEGVEVAILEKNFFEEADPFLRAQKKVQLDKSVVIINNNDAATSGARDAYAEFYFDCSTTCFIVWDWDNHHWLELSTFLAAHSDIYAPAHHENLYLLTRYNWLTAGPVYCTSVQWPRIFLSESLPEIILAERSPEPLGMHIPYANFSFRIQVISALNRHYSSIGFSNRSFHVRTIEDRLKEWYMHKTHWIIPVLNDVPIRVFDALVTGGIPIVPSSLRLLPPISEIPREYIAFYSPADILEPCALVEKVNELFDNAGRDGIVARHRFALDNFHGNNSVRKMLNYAVEVLNDTNS